MKKISLLLLPAILVLGACSKAPVNTYKVSEQEAKNAFMFKGLSNFEVDLDIMLVGDYGTHEEVKKTFDEKYYKNSNNEASCEYEFKDIITSVTKYQQYCEDKGIEYKESDFQAFISDYEMRGYTKTIEDGIYKLRWERSEEDYYKRINDYSRELVWNVDDADYRKVLEFQNYGADYSKENYFDTNYIDFSLLTYDEENKRYNIDSQSIGGIVYPSASNKYKFDTSTVIYSYVSFLNKHINKIDIFIEGTYQGNDISLSFTLEVKDINKVNYSIPDAEFDERDHEETYWSRDNLMHYLSCEDCDTFIEGSQGKCNYDSTGLCSICEKFHIEHEIILSYDFFGYPISSITNYRIPESNLSYRINYDNKVGETEAFDYITFVGDTKYYEKSWTTGTGAPLFYKGGSKTFVMLNNADFDYVFPETYTFETRKIEDEDKRVMVIEKTYHDAITGY